MQFEYQYRGHSTLDSRPGSTSLRFAPDTLRPPTYFDGVLRRKLPFREGISALHDVVVSDGRFQPKDQTEYKAWAREQELLALGELSAEDRALGERFSGLADRLRARRAEARRLTAPFQRAQSLYFQHLYEHHRTLWLLLDPVITVHPDELFFECFSRDESAYGRLSCSHEVFERLDDFACGTTNVDYSEALYGEFQRIREYKETRLTLDPEGFEVQTEGAEGRREVKIDLPDSWVRGFLQVSSAMTLPAHRLTLHPMDVHNLCFLLRRRKETHGPRSIRVRLEPDRPPKFVLEPWNEELVCSRGVYEGNDSVEIRLWGRRRLHLLERLIPVAKRFEVFLLGTGLPSFWVAELDGMTFTLGLSGWTANDWSRLGGFDLMAPRAAVDELTCGRVLKALQEMWLTDADDLASRVGLERSRALAALSVLSQSGRVLYDLSRGVYRLRELSREPLPMSRLRFADEREAEARRLLDRVHPDASQDAEGRLTLTGEVPHGQGHRRARLTLDSDERLVEGSCDCDFFVRNKLYKGPCVHMLALRTAHAEKTWRPKWFE